MKKGTLNLLTSINVLGLALYIVLASRGWRDPAEHGLIPVAGEPYVWAASLPFLAMVVLTDIVWGVSLIFGRYAEGTWLYVFCLFLLFSAVIVDFSHH
jgi:hypothetical protein